MNARPHLGHAYEKVAADYLARYHRLRGADVFYLTGVDEHGTKIEKAAAAAGISAQQFCDDRAAEFLSAWRCLNIAPDRFIRTTEAAHKQVVQSLFQQLLAQGDIYRGRYNGLYCEGCEDFVRRRDLDAAGCCPTHGKAPATLAEENYFFRLSRYKDAIRTWLQTCQVVQPDGRAAEVLNQLQGENELDDFSITRSRESVTWGIPVPGDSGQVIYVWFDALINYLSGAGYAGTDEQFGRVWAPDVQLIGKDITKFHAAYWPSILLAAGVELPKRIYAHGFLTVEGKKLSKSTGLVIDPVELAQKYGADAIRYFLLAKTSFGQDGDFCAAALRREANAALGNNVGNLLNRALALAVRYFDGKVPDCPLNEQVLSEFAGVDTIVEQSVSQFDFARALEAVIGVATQANKYFSDNKPWSTLAREDKTDGGTVIRTVLELLRITARQLHPATPGLSAKILNQLGYEEDQGLLCTTPSEPGRVLKHAGPVFARIE